MQEAQLFDIINGLEELNPRKAKKLRRLTNELIWEKNPTRRKTLEKKIRDVVYNIYLSCLSKKSRQDIYNTGIIISEECYAVERDAKDGWYIFFDGAKRLQKHGEGVTVSDVVPREYKKGFYLEEDATEKAKKFFKKYRSVLDDISLDMDHKQEMTTYDYQTKTPNIPIPFVERLVDYLGLSRIPKEDEKQK